MHGARHRRERGDVRPGVGLGADAGRCRLRRHRLYGVACPSTAQCTTVDNLGDEVTFNPGAPGKPAPTAVAVGHSLYGVACPSVTQCTAVDDAGQEVTFNPEAASHPSTVGVDSGHALLALACPSTTQCSALDDRGAEVTFDPRASRPCPI